MPNKLTQDAILFCNKGSKTSTLTVTSQDFCRAANKLVATEKDKKAEINIPNFGSCSITQSSCSPEPLKWDKTAEKDTINNFKILTDESACQCGKGGKIAVDYKGHDEKHEIN